MRQKPRSSSISCPNGRMQKHRLPERHSRIRIATRRPSPFSTILGQHELTDRLVYGDALNTNQWKSVYGHQRTAPWRDLSQGQGTVCPHPKTVDKVTPHPPSPHRTLRLLRPSRGWRAYSHQIARSCPRLETDIFGGAKRRAGPTIGCLRMPRPWEG